MHRSKISADKPDPKTTIECGVLLPNAEHAIIERAKLEGPGRGGPAAICDRLSGRQDVTPNLLDVVVLTRDLPGHGLRRGDLGAVVDLHRPEAFVVEFVAASGRTQALVTLSPSDIRAVADDDLVAVRPTASKAS